jgi:ATP-dependent Lon protease
VSNLEEENENLAAALDDLPVFPLPSVVLFPRALLPLHIFEPRYRAMLDHCMKTHRAMAVSLIADPNDKDANGEPRFASIAGVGIIIEHQPLSDGRSNILVHGRARVELAPRPGDTPFRRARATIRADVRTPVLAADRSALISAATAVAGELHKRDDFSFALPTNAEIDALADLCAQHLVLDPKTRQSLLEERDVAQRVRAVIAELALQHRAMIGKAGGPLS